MTSPVLTAGVNSGTINGGNGQVTIAWIPSTPNSTPTPTTVPQAKKTMTKLRVVDVQLPLGLGGLVIPIAEVSPPNVAGTALFKDGDTPLGPSVHVINGVAIGPIEALGPGQHTLFVVFTPDNLTAFQPSMDTVKVKFK